MQRTATLFLLLFPFFLFAQPEAYNWYFGNSRGLNFSTGSPVPLTDGEIQAPEGCASYSDANGNLLFYTNGGGRDPIISGGQPSGIIWNKNHDVLYNMGNTEGGGFSAAQSSLILPKPGAADQYLLFTMEEVEFNLGGPVVGQPQGRGLSLFEIDISLNGGLGEVVVADERIFTPTYEALSATQHASENAYWVTIFEANENANQFVTIFVDGNGIDQEDVNPQIVDFLFPLDGMIKISPNSQWLATNNYIFSFNNETGVVDNVPVVEMPDMSFGSFSPSSRYYYYWRETTTATFLARMDMMSSDIEDSEEVLLTLPSQEVSGQFQIASNGNIYFIRTPSFNASEYFVGEIECPDSPMPTIVTDLFSYTIDDDDPVQFPVYLGLPNFADYIFQSPDTELGVQSRRICPDGELVLTPRMEGVTYEWSDGSTEETLIITEPGQYTVTITDACGVIIVDEKEVTERNLPVVMLDSLPQEILCAGESFDLTVIPERFETIEWSTGDTTETITVMETGVYTVIMTNVCGSTSEEIPIEFLDIPVVDILVAPAGGICPGESAMLTATSNNEVDYLWSTGASLSSISVTEEGAYDVVVDNGCFTNSNSIDLRILPLPTVTIIDPAPLDSLCLEDEELTLSATAANADELAWTFAAPPDEVVVLNEGSLTTTARTNGIYEITASNDCGSVMTAYEVGIFSECVEEECGLELPEIFSPNNDGVNDRFGGFTNCSPVDYQLVVYSRWGKEIFSTSSADDFWLGNFQGEAAPSDAYLYQLQYRFTTTDELTTLRGSLTLVR